MLRAVMNRLLGLCEAVLAFQRERLPPPLRAVGLWFRVGCWLRRAPGAGIEDGAPQDQLAKIGGVPDRIWCGGDAGA